jgi:hypothetical protein
MSATAVSDCPTPTVSTITVEAGGLAEQHGLPGAAGDAAEGALDGDGRMKASGRRPSSSMRVLSPRMEPPDRELDGSTARTATSLALVDGTWCRRRR